MPEQQKSENRVSVWIPVIVAIIGLVGTITVALINHSPNAPNPTAPTPTQVVTRPTVTNAATQTETQTPSVTFSPAPSETPALTLTRTVVASVTMQPPSETSVPAVEPTNAPQITDNTHTLLINRSGDTVGLCVNASGDWTMLTIDFGGNERYSLGKVFPESLAGKAGDCWCLQQHRPIFNVPAICHTENTSVQPRIGDWRNATVTFIQIDDILGSCPPQPDNLDTYQCEIEVGSQ